MAPSTGGVYITAFSGRLKELSTRLAMSSPLLKLSTHASTILVSFFGFLFVHLVWAPWISGVWTPVKKRYSAMGKSGRNNWYVPCFSILFILLVADRGLGQVYTYRINHPYSHRYTPRSPLFVSGLVRPG